MKNEDVYYAVLLYSILLISSIIISIFGIATVWGGLFFIGFIALAIGLTGVTFAFLRLVQVVKIAPPGPATDSELSYGILRFASWVLRLFSYWA